MDSFAVVKNNFIVKWKKKPTRQSSVLHRAFSELLFVENVHLFAFVYMCMSRR